VNIMNATEESLFADALEKPPQERAAFLDAACAADPVLRKNVESLLSAYDAGQFLEHPAATAAQPASAEQPGTVIGPYKLLQEIGEGGMGTVWMAQQQEPVKRLVALKVIKPGMDSKQVMARFEAERQALALMDHPNIARVLDADTTPTGRPYFVMELVKGVPLTKYCDEHRLTPRERLELFIPVCQAIQHAHQKGIIHRDIKPSNVLVALYDGKPVPKVIDFGIAKAAGQALTERTLVTCFGAVVGTLEYMSPEQAELNQLDIDTRSDIYSLGVLLYELLTGTTPLDRKRLKEAALLEVLRVIREEEPPRPSTRLSTTEELPSVAANRGLEPKKLGGVVRGELDWIVMKALEKDRNRRYETASGLAMDVQRYLADEPVQACPPSAWYRLRKFARRKKTVLVMVACVLVALAGVVGSIGWAVRDKAAREEEVARDLAAREQQAARERRARVQQLVARVELILDEVDRLEREQKWPEAQAAAERAEAALAGGEADGTVRQRVADTRRDLEFVAALDRIRQSLAVSVDGKINNAGAARHFALAFREYGVDAEALPPEQAVAGLRGKPALAVPLATALDDWVSARRQLGEGEATWKPLVALARAIDPDLFRDRLRAVWGQRGTPELAAELRLLAESVDVKAQSPANLHALASTLIRDGLPDAAVQVLRNGQHTCPGDFWLSFQLANALHQRKDYAEAVRYGSVAVSLRPDSVAAHNNLAIVLRHQGKLDEAVAECRKALELAPRGAAMHTNLGNALADQGKLDAAVAEFRQAIALDPKLAVAHSNLGNALYKHGKVDEAVAEHRKAIALDPKLVVAHSNLGIALSDQGKLDEAVAEFRKAIALDPTEARSHYSLGSALYHQGELDAAIACYRKAIALDPRGAAAHDNLGIALYDQGRRNEAIAEYRKAIAIDPRNAMAHNNLGNALREQGKVDEAIANFRKAIALAPKLAGAHYNLGLALGAQGRRDEAIAEYRKAIEVKADYAEAHTNLGTLLHDQGNLDEAAAEYRKAIELKPKNAVAYNCLGSALSDQGRQDAAIACYRKAIAFDPKYAPAHRNLGAALCLQGKLDAGVAEFQKAIALDPKDAVSHYNLGATLREQGKLDAAIACYRKAIALDPQDAAAHSNLGSALCEQGKLDEAIAEYRKAIELKSDYAEAHCNLGRALRQQGRFRAALDELRRGHELGSKRPGWPHPSARWVQQAERLVELDAKLPAILKGETKPANTDECVELALVCVLYKKLNRAGAQLFAQAFAEQPQLADDLGTQHRYNAACAAALAGCGQGRDADPSDANERARLRRQALDWLRADLVAWGRLLEKEPDKTAPVLSKTMQYWQRDTDFAGMRGPEALAKLPEAERLEWQKLWADVADMLKRARGKTVSEKK
jgi:tetratricopeptide (TPR) repeat protein/serine/threonine protein kinase